MAIGDAAAARGMDLVSGTELANTLDTEDNKTRDYIDQFTKWANLSGKPSTFTPAAHSHAFGDITGKPSTYPPSSHSHDWASIAGKPSSFMPSAHTHDDRYFTESEADARFAAAGHSHAFSAITGKPTSYPNDDVSAATPSASPGTIARRGSTGAIAVVLGGETSAVPKNYCDDNKTTSASALTSGTLSRPVSTDGAGRFGAAWDNNITSTRRAAWIEADGTLGHTASSARYKKNITPMDAMTDEEFLQLAVVTFQWRNNVDPSEHIEVGMIAEALHDRGMAWAVFYEPDSFGVERPEGIHYDRLVLAVIPVLQRTLTRLASVEERLTTLEGVAG